MTEIISASNGNDKAVVVDAVDPPPELVGVVGDNNASEESTTTPMATAPIQAQNTRTQLIGMYQQPHLQICRVVIQTAANERLGWKI